MVITFPVSQLSIAAANAPQCRIFETSRMLKTSYSHLALRENGNQQIMADLYEIEYVRRLYFHSFRTMTDWNLFTNAYNGVLNSSERQRLFEYVKINLPIIVLNNGFNKDKTIFFIKDIIPLTPPIIPNLKNALLPKAFPYQDFFNGVLPAATGIVPLPKTLPVVIPAIGKKIKSRHMSITNFNSLISLSENEVRIIEDIMVFNIFQKNNDLFNVTKQVPCYLVNNISFSIVKNILQKESQLTYNDVACNMDELRRECIECRESSEFPKDRPGLNGSSTGKVIKITQHCTNTEALGVYYSNKTIFGKKGPAVFICPELIAKSTYGNYAHFIYLTAKVMIHEYCHAFSHATLDKDSIYNEPIYSWMEESTANAKTLEHLEKSVGEHNAFFVYASQFMQRQPDNYKLGFHYYDLNISGWDSWIKRGIDVKTKKNETKDFINYVQHYAPYTKSYLQLHLDGLF